MDGAGTGLIGSLGQDAEAGLPAAGLGGAGAAGRAGHGVRTAHAAGIAVAFAAAGQQQCRRHGTAQKSFLSLCHKRYAPFHLFGSSIARQESIYLCIFLLETVLYLSCGLPRPVLLKEPGLRLPADALLDGMSDKGIRIVTATAREITEVEKAED